jgi:cob(I)alamin adenosyltransferase
MFPLGNASSALTAEIKKELSKVQKELINTSSDKIRAEIKPYMERISIVENKIDRLLTAIEPISKLISRLPFTK